MDQVIVFREAVLADIPGMHSVRIAVRENKLTDPGRITYADYQTYLSERGKGWVCEKDGELQGFAIVDELDANIWALFVHPGAERKGIGKQLHALMLDWYFNRTDRTLWLSTSPDTRAAKFYTMQGWQPAGLYGAGELKFEMPADRWSTIE